MQRCEGPHVGELTTRPRLAGRDAHQPLSPYSRALQFEVEALDALNTLTDDPRELPVSGMRGVDERRADVVVRIVDAAVVQAIPGVRAGNDLAGAETYRGASHRLERDCVSHEPIAGLTVFAGVTDEISAVRRATDPDRELSGGQSVHAGCEMANRKVDRIATAAVAGGLKRRPAAVEGEHHGHAG